MAKVLRGNSFYTTVDGPSWEQAEARAVSYGGHLTTINDVDENSFIFSQTWGTGPCLYIGYSDAATEGVWKWADGSNSNYTNWWSPNEPSDGRGLGLKSGEDYAQLLFDGGGWQSGKYWNDVSNEFQPGTHYTPAGICEIPLNLTITRTTTPKEGAGNFTTSINLSAGTQSNITDGVTLYWRVSGITADDLSSGSLTGSGTISGGKLDINHSLVQDSDSGEQFAVSVFSDPAMTLQIGSTNSVGILEGIKNDGQSSFRIDGSATPGQSLTVNRSSDDPDGNGTPTYTWQSSSNGSWSTIGTGKSYQVNKNDQGKDIRALINYTDGEGFQESITTASLKIPFVNDGQASFRIDGSASLGQSITINRSSDDPDGNGTPNYTWQSSSNGSWSTIGSGQSYLITRNEQGKDIRVLVSYIDGEGFQESVPTSSITVSKSNTGSASFRIDGSASTGQVLTATKSSDDPDGNGYPSYLWQSSSNGSDWATIGNNQSYQITNADQGKQIRVQVSYQDGSGFSELSTTNTIKVPFTNSGSSSFAIAGSPSIGQLLSVTRVVDDPDGNGGTPNYTWKLQGDLNSPPAIVNNGSIYKVSKSDQGRTLQVEVSYVDGEGFTENPQPLTIQIPKIEVERSTYKINPSKSAIDEGQTLTTTITSDKARPGTTVYWSLSGDGIDKNDFSRGNLTGQGVLDGNGSLTISHSIKEDLSLDEGDETLNIAVFSDPTRTKLLTAPVQVLINDTSSQSSEEERFRTFNNEVQDYKVGTAKSDRLTVNDPERFKSLALWGEEGDDTLIGGTKDDYLIGGNGIDVLTGGKGSDTFVMSDYSQRSYDIIKDFVAKDDVIGISSNLIDASADDTVALMRYKDVKNRETAERFFKNKPADRYIIVDTNENIIKLNSSGYTEKVLLAVDLSNKAVLYDVDGRWNQGSDVLCKFTGKMSFDSWSADNFLFGIDVV